MNSCPVDGALFVACLNSTAYGEPTGNRTPCAEASGLQPPERPSLTRPKMALPCGVEPHTIPSQGRGRIPRRQHWQAM